MKKLLVSFMLMVSMVLSPAVSFAASENVMKCLKLVTGYDYADAVLTQAASLVEIGIAKTTCTEQLMSLDPVFYSLLGAAIALKNTTTINTKSGCQNLITGTINSALDSSIDEAFGSNLTPQQKADLKNAAANQAQQSLSSIPGFNYWGCACEYAYSGLIVARIKELVQKEGNALKACGSLTGINDILSWAAKWTGLGCPDDKKINRDQYIEKVLKAYIKKYALMDNNERLSEFINQNSGQWQGCKGYYNGGPSGCRMEEGNANKQCNEIMADFNQRVLNYQPTIVKDAIASCSKVYQSLTDSSIYCPYDAGDGCAKDKAEPLMIDAYGNDAMINCVMQGIKSVPSCKPKEQPCCFKAPLTPNIKCAKACAEAASKVGVLGSQIGQGFNNLQPAYADAQMIADRQACQQTIMGNALKYLQNTACEAAKKTPTDDISGIWPEALQAAKGLGTGEALTKCDAPYTKKANINKCKDMCSQPATLQALYGRTDTGAEHQCNSDCPSRAILSKMPGPAYEQMKIDQQSGCVEMCKFMCQESSVSMECQNCQKPNWCGSGASRGTGSSSGPGVAGGLDKAGCLQKCDSEPLCKANPNSSQCMQCKNGCTGKSSGSYTGSGGSDKSLPRVQ